LGMACCDPLAQGIHLSLAVSDRNESANRQPLKFYGMVQALFRS
jgi:hypothetical protein